MSSFPTWSQDQQKLNLKGHEMMNRIEKQKKIFCNSKYCCLLDVALIFAFIFWITKSFPPQASKN